MTFADSKVDVVDDGRSLLEQAEAAGLKPENGCRMGICHTCTRRKTSGTVRNLVTGAVSTAPDENVQICVIGPGRRRRYRPLQPASKPTPDPQEEKSCRRTRSP